MIKRIIKRMSFIDYIYQSLIGKKKTERILSYRRKILREQGRYIVCNVEEALQSCKTRFFLCGGSLLGMIRDGKFMEYDDDIDYGIFFDNDYSWGKLEQDLGRYGFKKTREFVVEKQIIEQTYQINGLPIDFFKIEDEDKHSILTWFMRIKGFSYKDDNEFTKVTYVLHKIDTVRRIEINGLQFNAPEQPEVFLEDLYTTNWPSPDPKWDPNKNPNFHVYREIKGKVIEYR